MINKLYTKYAKKYGEAVKDNLYNTLYEQPSSFAMIPDVKDLNVLDMGCGTGVYSKHLIDLGAKVTSIDISEDMISIIKDKLGKEINAYLQNLDNGIPLEKDNTFDLVISPLTIHYVKDFNFLFKEVSRVLKNKGTFLFSMHHPMIDFNSSISKNYFERELIIENWDTIGEPVEVMFYRRSLTELFTAIENSGMSVISLNEGKPDIKMKAISERIYNKLSTKPGFLFIKCKKLN